MSEKIILEITPEVARKIQDFLTSAEKIAPDEADAWDQIVQQLGGNLERSVLEWHDWDEKIPDEILEEQPILMRWKDPMLKEFVYDVTTKYDIYGCQEWAVLPEVPK